MSSSYQEFGKPQQPENKNGTPWIAQKISDAISTFLGIALVVIVAVVSYNLGAIRGQPIVKIPAFSTKPYLAPGFYGLNQSCQYDQTSDTRNLKDQ